MVLPVDGIRVYPDSCGLWLQLSFWVWKYNFLLLKGDSENSQLVSGSTNSFDILNLEGGVSYTVRVTALVGSREGEPVSITVTTRKTHILLCVHDTCVPSYSNSVQEVGLGDDVMLKASREWVEKESAFPRPCFRGISVRLHILNGAITCLSHIYLYLPFLSQFSI